MCLVAFQKKFRKIFSGVWKRRRKHKSRKTQATTQIQSGDKSSPMARSRSRLLREIAIFLSRRRRDLPLSRSRDRRFVRSRRRSRSRSGAISRRRDRDQRRYLVTARSRSTATGMFVDEIAIVGLCRLSRARALSLSLCKISRTLKGKYKCKMIFVVKGIFFRSTDFNFWKIEFSGPTK